MDTTKTFLPGPYSLGGSEPVVIDGVERAPGIIMRENSGALVILAPDEGEDVGSDRRRIGTVDLIDHRPKRGEGWKTKPEDDPRQMAIARLWMASPDLLIQLEGALAMLEEYHREATGVDDFKHTGISGAIAKARGA